MAEIKKPTKVAWNEIEKVGRPSREMSTMENGAPRTFLCRGEYSIFVSTMFDDLSGFAEEGEDKAQAWAVIEGY